MRIKFNHTLLLLVFFLFSCSQYNGKENSDNTVKALPQVNITVVNFTPYQLKEYKTTLSWGSWVTRPTKYVNAYGKSTFSSRGSPTNGTEGNVDYVFSGGAFNVYWDITHWGVRKHGVRTTVIYSDFNVACGNCNTDNITIYVSMKETPNSYTYLAMSDPQAWRLDKTGHDHNWGQADWEKENKKVVESINKFNKDGPPYRKTISFGIINGDITEYGREATRRSFDSVYTNNIPFPLLIGLGNHDYDNNVNDCSEGFDSSRNACARWAFYDLIDRIDGYRLFLNDFSTDYNKSQNKGSGGYSWDMGQIHFVQLNNYPTYKVTLDHWAASTIHVTKSLEWLKKDLEDAKARGKSTVLNFHDAYQHFKNNTTAEEKALLEKMIEDNDVIAIFSGHSHNASVSDYGYLRGVKHFDSGALFKGDFLAVSVSFRCIKVTRYNGASGEAIEKGELGTVCGKK